MASLQHTNIFSRCINLLVWYELFIKKGGILFWYNDLLNFTSLRIKGGKSLTMSILCLNINLSFFTCTFTSMCLPLAIHWKFGLGCYNFEEMPILQSMTSNTYRDTLVASVAILIIWLIDVVFEGVYTVNKLRVLFSLRVGVLLRMMIAVM